MKTPPDYPMIMHLEVAVMPNGEIICLGKKVGMVAKLGEMLKPAETPTEHVNGALEKALRETLAQLESLADLDHGPIADSYTEDGIADTIRNAKMALKKAKAAKPAEGA